MSDNLDWWNERSAMHLDAALYRPMVRALREGGQALLPLERRELGELGGLRVVHMQCHIGTDTLSLLRLGAKEVLGLDFSPVGVDVARQLNAELGMAARFEVAAVGEMAAVARSHGHAPFDLVFTSHGVLSWLADLELWARDVGELLAPGGRLYLSEQHPMAAALDAPAPGELRVRYPYSTHGKALQFNEPGSYAQPGLTTTHDRTQDYSWGLGEVVNALIGAGLVLESLTEHQEGFFPSLSTLERGGDGHWRLPVAQRGLLPLGYSIWARRPASS